MTTPPLQATLDALTQAGARYQLSLFAPEGDGWFCPADLLDADSPTFARLAEAVRAREPGVSRRYTGLLIYSRCTWMLAWLGLSGFLTARRVPAVDLTTLRYHWNEGGWIDGLALGTTQFYALADDPDAAHADAIVLDSVAALREQFRQFYEASIARLIPAYRAQSGMGPAALWAAASDACSFIILGTLEPRQQAESAAAEIDALIEAAGSRLSHKSGVLWIEHQGVRAPFVNRVGCCLWYTVPGKEAHYCSTCPLRPLEERQEIARGYLAERAAAG